MSVCACSYPADPCTVTSAAAALQGRDFTLYSKTAGFVSFRHEKHVPHGRKPSAYKERRYIDVLPVDGDWSEAYRSKVAEMVHRRNAVRLAALGHAARYGKR